MSLSLGFVIFIPKKDSACIVNPARPRPRPPSQAISRRSPALPSLRATKCSCWRTWSALCFRFCLPFPGTGARGGRHTAGQLLSSPPPPAPASVLLLPPCFPAGEPAVILDLKCPGGCEGRRVGGKWGAGSGGIVGLRMACVCTPGMGEDLPSPPLPLPWAQSVGGKDTLLSDELGPPLWLHQPPSGDPVAPRPPSLHLCPLPVSSTPCESTSPSPPLCLLSLRPLAALIHLYGSFLSSLPASCSHPIVQGFFVLIPSLLRFPWLTSVSLPDDPTITTSHLPPPLSPVLTEGRLCTLLVLLRGAERSISCRERKQREKQR